MSNTAAQEPRSLVEAVRYFADPGRSFAFVKDLRWPDGKVTCPRCGVAEPSFLTTRRIWKCKGCHKQFSLKIGTIFEDSPLGWDKWLPAVWLLANSKNSISSHELGRALGITQKSAWFVLHRLRDTMATGSYERMSGITEVDDTFIGGLAKNMHRKARAQRIHGTGGMDKMTVQGARNRDSGTVTATVIAGTDSTTIQEHIYQWVEPGSALFTDEHASYKGLEEDFAIKQVNHARGEYVSGDVHTNGIENFWSLLKRSIKGTQNPRCPGPPEPLRHRAHLRLQPPRCWRPGPYACSSGRDRRPSPHLGAANRPDRWTSSACHQRTSRAR